jgi:hypothetical protein
VAYARAGVAAEPTPCTADGLRVEAKRARTWRYAWSGINAGLMVGSFAILPAVDRETWPDWIVSGAGSGVTLLATWFWPLRAESAADELDALPPAERVRALPRLLRESAEDEHDRVTWPWHVANAGLSLGAGAIIAFGYDHYVSGAVTAVAGTALGEVQILTQPTELPESCPQALRLMPRLGYEPSRHGTPSAWTLSLSGSF